MKSEFSISIKKSELSISNFEINNNHSVIQYHICKLESIN